MNLPIIVLGAGGHAKVLIEALLKSGAVIAGVVDPDPKLCGALVLSIPLLGSDDIIYEFPIADIQLVNGLGSVGYPIRRQHIFEKFKDMGYTFASVTHPASVIASDVVLGEGAQVMAGAVIQPGSRIGINSIINTCVSVDHDCMIGDHVHIAPGVTISGGVKVGNGTHVGTGATIIQGALIDNDCFVAAGAVVTRDVIAGTKVRGVPAREFV